MPAVLVTVPTGMQNLPFLLCRWPQTIASTRCMDPQRDGQAEWPWKYRYWNVRSAKCGHQSQY